MKGFNPSKQALMILDQEQSFPLAKETYIVHCRFGLQTTIQQRDMVPSRIRPCGLVVFLPILKIQTTICAMAQKITLEAPLPPTTRFKQACPQIEIEFTNFFPDMCEVHEKLKFCISINLYIFYIKHIKFISFKNIKRAGDTTY